MLTNGMIERIARRFEDLSKLKGLNDGGSDGDDIHDKKHKKNRDTQNGTGYYKKNYDEKETFQFRFFQKERPERDLLQSQLQLKEEYQDSFYSQDNFQQKQEIFSRINEKLKAVEDSSNFQKMRNPNSNPGRSLRSKYDHKGRGQEGEEYDQSHNLPELYLPENQRIDIFLELLRQLQQSRNQDQKQYYIKKASKKLRTDSHTVKIEAQGYRLLFQMQRQISQLPHKPDDKEISKRFAKKFIDFIQKNINSKRYRLLKICYVVLKGLGLGYIRNTVWLDKLVNQNHKLLRGINLAPYSLSLNENLFKQRAKSDVETPIGNNNNQRYLQEKSSIGNLSEFPESQIPNSEMDKQSRMDFQKESSQNRQFITQQRKQSLNVNDHTEGLVKEQKISIMNGQEEVEENLNRNPQEGTQKNSKKEAQISFENQQPASSCKDDDFFDKQDMSQMQKGQSQFAFLSKSQASKQNKVEKQGQESSSQALNDNKQNSSLTQYLKQVKQSLKNEREKQIIMSKFDKMKNKSKELSDKGFVEKYEYQIEDPIQNSSRQQMLKKRQKKLKNGTKLAYGFSVNQESSSKNASKFNEADSNMESQLQKRYPPDFMKKIAKKLDNIIVETLKTIFSDQSQQICLEKKTLVDVYKQYGYYNLKQFEGQIREEEEAEEDSLSAEKGNSKQMKKAIIKKQK